MACLGRGYGPLTLDALNYECLHERVVDLPFIMVNATVSFIFHFRLMVSRLRQYHNLGVLSTVTATLLHLLLVLSRALTDHDATRVACISEVYGISVLIDCDNSTATQTTIEASLLFKFSLNLKEAGLHGFSDSLVLCLY